MCTVLLAHPPGSKARVGTGMHWHGCTERKSEFIWLAAWLLSLCSHGMHLPAAV
jgi:hypothetical protein